MKKGTIILILIVFMCSFISADIIFNEQPKAVYNLGNTVYVPVTVKTTGYVSGVFQMDLICNSNQINFYKNGVNLAAGEEKTMESSLVLIKEMIGTNTGTCRIKAILGDQYALSNDFKISNLLNIEGSLAKTEVNPGESISVSGKVTREDGEDANGFVEIRIFTDANQNITQLGTVTGKLFSMNFSLPSKLKAGRYLVNLKAYEKDSTGAITNNGLVIYNFSVRQIPTNLELVMENKEIMPGTSLRVKAILHDQTGESINSTVFITIKDSNDKILDQEEVQANTFIDYPIKSNQAPAQWKVFSISSQLSAEDTFQIKTKEEINVEIVNKTILVKNTGNVNYNKTLLVKIGDAPLNIQLSLKVGESRKYVLSAPDGQYNVEVVSSDGKDKFGDTMSLTGKAVDIKEASGMSYGVAFWSLLILILLAVAFIIFRKVYKKPFFGHITSKKDNFKKVEIKNNSLAGTVNKAELSLSIKGEKQDASVICIKIKNLKELRTGRGSPAESIRKIIEAAEENKAVTYENLDYLFFILAPAKTRTFKNERIALDISEKIENILKEHNRMFNQKMDFGISLNQGTIVGKVEDGVFRFMSMGTLVTASRKIASLAKGEVLLSENINDLLRLNTRTEKHVREGTSVFIVKEIKRENEEAKKFIDRFMNRQSKQ